MTQSQLSVGCVSEYTTGRKRHHTGSRQYARAFNDDSPIMQRGIWIKYLQDQFRRDLRVHNHTGMDKIFEVIREIRHNGVTILLVEQDVQEALEACDRAYVIQTGRVVMEGAGRDVLNSELIQKAFLGL